MGIIPDIATDLIPGRQTPTGVVNSTIGTRTTSIEKVDKGLFATARNGLSSILRYPSVLKGGAGGAILMDAGDSASAPLMIACGASFR